MKLNNLRDLLVHDLQDIYDAEHQVVKALPKMAEAVKSPQLRTAFEEHLKQTREQIDRLEEVFRILGEEAKGEPCVGMKGLIEEGKKIIEGDADQNVRDAALIASAQKVEHYEIAAYGTARAYAQILGEKEVDSLLLKTLDEEGHTNDNLNRMAMTKENLQAQRGGNGK